MATIALRDHSFLSGSEHIFTEKSFRGKGDSHLILTHSTLCTTGLVNLSPILRYRPSPWSGAHRYSISKKYGKGSLESLYSKLSIHDVLFSTHQIGSVHHLHARLRYLQTSSLWGKKASGRQRGLEKSPGLKRSSPGVSGLIKAFCSADPQRLRWSEYKSSFLMPRSHAHFTDLFDSDGLKLD